MYLVNTDIPGACIRGQALIFAASVAWMERSGIRESLHPRRAEQGQSLALAFAEPAFLRDGRPIRWEQPQTDVAMY